MKTMVYNRQKKIKLSRETRSLIRKAAKICEKRNGFQFPCEACIMLVDNEEIKRLNSKFRNIDAPTDVLSFPLMTYSKKNPDIRPGDLDPDTKRVPLGDIMISVEKALEQAESYGHSPERELAFLAVHGMLHLLGYDHETPEEEKDMFQRQEEVLRELGLARE
jgi:probable rRNA maturation factor